jgi:glutathione S-transferase
MKLYTYPPAPNPRRLQIFMAEKGISIPSEHVDLMKREQLTEAYRAINPLGTVPALLTDEGTVLTQVVAICDYLEALHPQTPLLGRTPLEKALIREWSHRVFMEGFAAIADAFRNGNPAFAHRAMPGPLDVEQIPALVERGLQRLGAFWNTLDTHLANRDYMVGDAFSMADIDAVVACGFAGWIRQKIPGHCANLLRWHAAIAARPSVAT